MDRLTKVGLILLAWLVVAFHLIGFTPSGLGSWSAGIDLRRYSIQTYHSIAPSFLNSDQSTWFQQASADPVYGVFFGIFSIVTGAKTLQEGLWNLDWIQPALVLYGLAALAAARFFGNDFGRNIPRNVAFLLPVLFILPVGRIHVLLNGFQGSALAPALLVLILLLLIKWLLAKRAEWRYVLLVLLLSLALVNTYHTWATYFAILCVVTAGWLIIRKKRVRASGRPITRIMAIVPVLWMFAAVYLGNGPLFARFVDAITVLRTYRPAILSIGIYDPSSAGPLAPYLRGFPLLSFENVIYRTLLIVFTLLTGWSTIRLLRISRSVQEVHPEANLAVGLSISSAATVLALASLGGVNLAIERGFELLGVTGPFIIALALPLLVTDERSPGGEKESIAKKRDLSGKVVAWSLVVIVVLLIATSFQAIGSPSRNELLGESEIASLQALSKMAGNNQTVWSDDRLAPAFLYFERTQFVTFDVRFSDAEAANAALALFYEGNCLAGMQYLKDSGATIAVLSRYMEEVGVVLRTGAFNPATTVAACLDQSASRIFDSGSVAAYAIAQHP